MERIVTTPNSQPTSVSGEPRITIDPDVCNGKPVIRGLRITVETILGHLGAGDTEAEILRQYPMLVKGDIAACLAFASRLMGHKYNVKALA